jgi:predicted metal-binding protein
LSHGTNAASFVGHHTAESPVTTITVCTTCKFPPGQDFGPEGRSGGALLADALETEARNRNDAPRIVRHECLWACAHSCAILIGSTGKTGYLAGRFEPGPVAAAAILDWAAAYAESDDGTVRYARWPEGMKGHFIARIPNHPGGGGDIS